MSKLIDIVSDIIQLFREAAPAGLSDDQVIIIERRIRQQYGGDEHYVRKDESPREQQKRAAIDDFCHGRITAKEVKERHGISRASLYRGLGKKAPK